MHTHSCEILCHVTEQSCNLHHTDFLPPELVLRKINTGELTVETLCLPYVHLECVDVKEM